MGGGVSWDGTTPSPAPATHTSAAVDTARRAPALPVEAAVGLPALQAQPGQLLPCTPTSAGLGQGLLWIPQLHLPRGLEWSWHRLPQLHRHAPQRPQIVAAALRCGVCTRQGGQRRVVRPRHCEGSTSEPKHGAMALYLLGLGQGGPLGWWCRPWRWHGCVRPRLHAQPPTAPHQLCRPQHGAGDHPVAGPRHLVPLHGPRHMLLR